jgi:HD superfamily phosphohydrolase
MGEQVQRFKDVIAPLVRSFLHTYCTSLRQCRTESKIFRDAIFGFQSVRAYEIAVIDSPLFQRLRNISQTSVAYYTYQSAIHSRFEHSLNCMHLAEMVLEALCRRSPMNCVERTEWAEVRLAALLHDVGHGIFSHGSEFYFSGLDEARELLEDELFHNLPTTASEAVNYCIITSEPFQELFTGIRRIYSANPEFSYLGSITDLDAVADMIIGRAPRGNLMRQYQTDIINGPFDVDKLDYLTRDSYFTGINFSVDIDRLMPSLKVWQPTGRSERRLVVDAKGIAVLEQLLFGKLLLYDTVYHHHKVRAATQNLHQIFRCHGKDEGWKTTSGHLENVADFIEMDETDFFGQAYDSASLSSKIRSLKHRELYRRALVIMPRCLADRQSYTKLDGYWADLDNRKQPLGVEKASAFFEDIKARAERYAKVEIARCGDPLPMDGIAERIFIDVPQPPRFNRIGDESLIEISPELVVRLSELFPFNKVVENYAEQYKYRTYVFAPGEYLDVVAYAVYRAFGERGVSLNDLALILAHRVSGVKSAKERLRDNHVDVLSWQEHSYTPDIDDFGGSGP